MQSFTSPYIHTFALNTPSGDAEKIVLPSDIEQAKELGAVLLKYKDQYFPHVLGLYVSSYILYVYCYACYILASVFFSRSDPLLAACSGGQGITVLLFRCLWLAVCPLQSQPWNCNSFC
jgi:hypothetical protein